MDVATAELIWSGAGVYFGIGLLVAIALACGLVRRFDSLAAEAPWRVKLVLIPGMMALWPLLAAKAIGQGGPR